MQHPNEYRGKSVVVLGMARSGVAVAKLFHAYGANVTVNDKKERDLCPEADELTALGISVLCGGHPPDLINKETALVVKNPGIFYSTEPVKRALALGIEVVTEVEVAAYICEAPIIGITGSNGKTTTTTWIGKMLETAGLKPIVAGNIGRALCDAAQDAEADNWMVVELSSFQLKGTVHFHPRIACLLNVYETHLDYHGTMEDYAGSKAKLFANQTEADTAVLNWDDAYCRSLIPWIKAKIVPFSMAEELVSGVFLRTLEGVETIVYRSEDGNESAILTAAKLGIPGRHNIQNALAAVAVALAAGASEQAIAEALQQFRGVEHRLEFVRDKDGVSYVNGSKATNPAATIKDLEAFSQPIVLIAGGLDRGMEYDSLVPYFQGRLTGLIALGETRDKLARTAEQATVPQIRIIASIDPEQAMMEAVEAARLLAKDGDVVLLSPACASWDMFTSYEQRGSMFKRSVHTL
ncbi:UDP-N-acetylmuramoyl-L-alanine--D-glutamate ligase [Gorillibacterium massiliense]|uniref:UDP-N-acetylmuramoyl-L-alanine--D-glutamate ligase n=1 Tax=Gorillibacterium massiliense TaxID=1280390 RepID=UPI0004B86C02|nr:UDP-N-acetylmuramoyl-L-alanine--D-glutamate ligase [Gorillibacterium massiliense]